MSELIFDDEEIKTLAYEIERIGESFDQDLQKYIIALRYIKDRGFKKGSFSLVLEHYIDEAEKLMGYTAEISTDIKNSLMDFVTEVDSIDRY